MDSLAVPEGTRERNETWTADEVRLELPVVSPSRKLAELRRAKDA